jgi:hypothetical protein
MGKEVLYPHVTKREAFRPLCWPKRQIDELMNMINAQEPSSDWTSLTATIKESKEGYLVLEIPEAEISIAFDKSGNDLLGIVNYKQ